MGGGKSLQAEGTADTEAQWSEETWMTWKTASKSGLLVQIADVGEGGEG